MDDNEFESWLAVHYPLTSSLSGAEVYWIKSAWFESAKRADRKAREECAEICKSTKEYGLSREEINRNLLRGNPDGKTDGFQKAVDKCYSSIRATIKEIGQ